MATEKTPASGRTVTDSTQKKLSPAKTIGAVDLSIFIGRFSPFHNGHAAVLTRAIKKSKVVQVLVGSSYEPRTIKNPFTYDERRELIWNWYVDEVEAGRLPRGRLRISALQDTPYNDQLWIRDVQLAEWKCKNAYADELGLNPIVAITGAKRDSSGWYLDAFPKWERDFISADESDFTLSATKLREVLFNNPSYCSSDAVCSAHFGTNVPPTTLGFLVNWLKSEEANQLRQEYRYIENYKMAWEAAPYAPTFVTVDAVVVQSGHILLVKRRAAPGKGLWALPGGFVNQAERLQDAAIRELREETKLKVPVPVLRGNIKSKEIFDHPDRSLRGRTITTAFLIQLPDGAELPEVKGGSDAEKAEWVPIAQVESMRERLFEDHFHIISTMLGRITD